MLDSLDSIGAVYEQKYNRGLTAEEQNDVLEFMDYFRQELMDDRLSSEISSSDREPPFMILLEIMIEEDIVDNNLSERQKHAAKTTADSIFQMEGTNRTVSLNSQTHSLCVSIPKRIRKPERIHYQEAVYGLVKRLIYSGGSMLIVSEAESVNHILTTDIYGITYKKEMIRPIPVPELRKLASDNQIPGLHTASKLFFKEFPLSGMSALVIQMPQRGYKRGE